MDNSKQLTLIVVCYLVIVYIENEINWYITIENIHNYVEYAKVKSKPLT